MARSAVGTQSSGHADPWECITQGRQNVWASSIETEESEVNGLTEESACEYEETMAVAIALQVDQSRQASEEH